MTGAELAAAAEALVGTRFRLHGRDPATGLDCVGVLAAALGGDVPLPNLYALRARYLPDLGEVVARCGFTAVRGTPVPGDVLMVRIGPCQFHVLVAIGVERFVHADLGLRRVVRCDSLLEWLVVGHWRLSECQSSPPKREREQ
jgi:hypothetical protein